MKHTREETLSQLQLLGEELGFTVTTLYGSDLSWCLRENEPVFTFIIDDQDGSRGYRETINKFWATADYIAKPWSHHLILTHENLRKDQENMITALSSQFNIRVHSPVNLDQLRETLIIQVKEVAGLLKRYVMEEPSIHGLKPGIEKWRTSKPRTDIKYKMTRHSSLETLEIYKETAEFTQSRKTPPLTAESNGAEMESILLRLVDVKDTALRFDTEHRNLPVFLELNIDTMNKKTLMFMGFEADKSNISQALSFERFVQNLDQTGKMKLVEPNTGTVVFDFIQEK